MEESGGKTVNQYIYQCQSPYTHTQVTITYVATQHPDRVWWWQLNKEVSHT